MLDYCYCNKRGNIFTCWITQKLITEVGEGHFDFEMIITILQNLK